MRRICPLHLNLGIMTTRDSILDYLKNQVLIADGAMGTMIQNADLDLTDFLQLEGCNEILNRTRPEVIENIHLSYFSAGSDAVETNSFGCNFANLSEYGIESEIYDLSLKASQIARSAADQSQGIRFVLGSMGPGTKLPSLGHTTFDALQDSYYKNALGLIEGGADALLIETSQDLLQVKAAIIGAQLAMNQYGHEIPIFSSITVEQNGTMLLGSEVSAAISSLVNLGISAIGMNCATGPEEMSEHLRLISQTVDLPISCMPNAGLPILVDGNATYPLEARPFADYLDRFTHEYGLSIIGGCCGTTPEHITELRKLAITKPIAHESHLQDSVSSIYQSISLIQDGTYLNVGERANANGSKAFRDALLNEDFEECIEIATSQVRSGAHVLDLCVDYVGRDGVSDMSELSARLATASTLPIMLDSTEPAVVEAGLKHLGGRCLINSLNFEDGDGPESRFLRMLKLAKMHGAAVVALTIDEEGQSRTAEWKTRVARRLIDRLTSEGIPESSILVDTLTFPIATGQEETRRDGIETLLAIKSIKDEFPSVKTILGLSNISFGLNPAARQALNSVFLNEARAHGLDAAIVDSSRILPLNQISEDKKFHLLNLIYDRRTYSDSGEITYDPLTAVLDEFADSTTVARSANSLSALAEMPIDRNLRTRIVDGIGKELTNSLDIALLEFSPLEIVNEILLPAMKEVGELFGAGVMQLPFVLQSAEVMKASVGYLEGFMERSEHQDKGKVLLATVKGDVHDIGKNLVDIILTNNGFTVYNIGIKQTIQQIIDAADENQVDVIGMSGLLVKSTVIMRENLEELNSRGLASKYPVILGGAALTRAYVEDDLADIYEGTVRYAKDAFEGLSLSEAIIQEKRTGTSILPPLRKRIHKMTSIAPSPINESRSSVSMDNPIPEMPFYGSKVVKGIPLGEIASWLDERATFVGQWGLKPSRDDSKSLEMLIEQEGRPRLRYWLEQIQKNNLNEFGVVYGYFPAYSEGNRISILNEDRSAVLCEMEFPRQSKGDQLCLSDYIKPKSSNENDFVAFHMVTMGNAVSQYANKLFSEDKYRDYLEIHGLSVQLTEALAEMWHARIRRELKIDENDAPDLQSILKQDYQGERYSFGYPACPDLALQVPLMDLLHPERIGIELSEEFQLHPEQSTSAIIFHHPEARYFNAR